MTFTCTSRPGQAAVACFPSATTPSTGRGATSTLCSTSWVPSRSTSLGSRRAERCSRGPSPRLTEPDAFTPRSSPSPVPWTGRRRRSMARHRFQPPPRSRLRRRDRDQRRHRGTPSPSASCAWASWRPETGWSARRKPSTRSLLRILARTRRTPTAQLTPGASRSRTRPPNFSFNPAASLQVMASIRQSPSIGAELGRSQTRAMLLTGECSAQMPGWNSAILGADPRMRRVILPGVGHHLWNGLDDHNARAADAIASFLAERPPSRPGNRVPPRPPGVVHWRS